MGNRKDRGGNRIRVSYSGRKVNLHSLWDGGLIDWREESLQKYAKRLNIKLVDSEKKEWLNSEVNDWANESRYLALKYAYPLENMKLSKEYLSRSREILDQRMIQAGIRLADLLNQLFKSKK